MQNKNEQQQKQQERGDNMTDSDEKQRALDASMENEASAPSPIVKISLKEYDKLKEKQHYITDKSLIEYIDKIEFFVKELRKHIVRKF